MKVAVLYSGGKDSTMALGYALSKGWQIEALISVKPKNEEAYLWHYSNVEWTRLQAEALNLPLIFLKSKEIGPKEEARELENVLKNLRIDALILGGVGLQKTQIKAIGEIAEKFNIKILVPYRSYSSDQLLIEEIDSGIEAIITNEATEGLGEEWLGQKLSKENVEEIINLSKKFGFDPLFEGGSADTFVIDAPFFKKRINILSSKKIWDKRTNSGYLQIEDAVLLDKK